MLTKKSGAGRRETRHELERLSRAPGACACPDMREAFRDGGGGWSEAVLEEAEGLLHALKVREGRAKTVFRMIDKVQTQLFRSEMIDDGDLPCRRGLSR